MDTLELTILFGTETGNCKDLANKVAKKAAKNNVTTKIADLASYSVEDLAGETAPVLFIVSTWGDGAPPPKCEAFFQALHASEGPMEDLKFGILALGDSEYPLFCECGKKLEVKLEGLGAESMVPRTDMDADFLVTYIGWSKRFWKTMAGVYGIKK
ncbi:MULTISPECIES: flavodoxin domain-containing protein [unclassified Lentimonas]|uniref:flavodoxin domain-containing protein n=1 Tax=unclassified Lentimonas TaxID=2630993 RepID=UPI001327BFD9|nr:MULTISPECIES: flavodoxin domain-containing protein [unclassified Lentimonas]CAA6694990.1 Hypothetical flavoprotein YqcA (clustered with tRNA pseudouridine synthase C) [Lentimonas sp. CC19]CAA6695351.1 Hypothetical flavoprotein YqcA (clustered with tRNA pseudouridine synthase C) [Lentimonas sp. CC10]CAA7072021.1 Hypothetical flavoprotein YqcA (clustered with tRNA pseudouridine synthase C) [Lentimonas sp. CC11]